MVSPVAFMYSPKDASSFWCRIIFGLPFACTPPTFRNRGSSGCRSLSSSKRSSSPSACARHSQISAEINNFVLQRYSQPTFS